MLPKIVQGLTRRSHPTRSLCRAYTAHLAAGVILSHSLLAQETDPNRPGTFEGNWEITYFDTPAKGQTLVSRVAIAHAWTVPPDPAFEKGVGVGASRPPRVWQPARDPRSPLIYATNPDRNPTGSVGEIKPAGGAPLKLKHPYSFLGHWGGTSEVRLTGPNTATGRWTYGDKGGTERWRRVRPRIAAIEYHGTAKHRVEFGEAVGRLETRYGADDWVAGNRPGFVISVFGEGLWGYHVTWIDGAGVNGSGWRPIYRPGAPSAPENVIGLAITGKIWSAATPGRMHLYVDGIRIPFELVVNGFPEEKLQPPPELRFVRAVEGRLEATSTLRHGDEFHVEAHYPRKPARPPGAVELTWTDGQPRSVAVLPTSDARVFRSALLRLAPP